LNRGGGGVGGSGMLIKSLYFFSPSRLQLFRTRVARLWATSFQDDEQVFLADLVQAVNEGLGNDALFGTSEATMVCQAMTEANEVMLSDGIVYKI
jgi:DNA replication licensing factor MCM3